MNKIIVASAIGLGLIASSLVPTDAQAQRRGGVAVFHGPAGGTTVFRGGPAFHPYYGGGWHGGHCCWNGYAWVAPAIIGGAILGGALAAPYLYAPPPRSTTLHHLLTIHRPLPHTIRTGQSRLVTSPVRCGHGGFVCVSAKSPGPTRGARI